MLQRNDTGSPVTLMTSDPIVSVDAGAVIDYDLPVPGFTQDVKTKTGGDVVTADPSPATVPPGDDPTPEPTPDPDPDPVPDQPADSLTPTEVPAPKTHHRGGTK